MNAQERTLLVQFLDQLISAQAGRKDPEAEALIREASARQPDAAYLLVQRALQLEQALDITKAELQRLQSETPQSRETASFLGNPNAWGRSSSATTTPTGAPVPAASPSSAAPTGPAVNQPPQRFGSGMLGNVAATAAGVVAGSFLFQGVQNLLGRHGTDAPWGATATPAPARDDVALEDVSDDAQADDSFDTSGWDDGGDMGGDGGDYA
jgi:uncharacterized protein